MSSYDEEWLSVRNTLYLHASAFTLTTTIISSSICVLLSMQEYPNPGIRQENEHAWEILTSKPC